MKKRIFSILLSIGLTLTLLPGTVLATGPDAGPAEEVIAASQTPVMIEAAEEPLQTPDEAEEVELLQVPEETPGEVIPEKETPGEDIMTLQAAAQGETVSQAIQTDALGADAPATVEMHVATEGHGKVRVDGTDYDTEFKGEREDGTNVQVEAVPDESYKLGRWLIRKNSGNPVLVYDAATTLVAGTDLEAIAYFGLEKAYVTITPPAAGTTAATAPQITFPDGAGYSLDTLPWEGPATYWTTSESLSTSYPEDLDESTVFEPGQTYYAYVRLADGEDSFAARAGGSSFNTDLEVSGGKKMDQGNVAGWSEEHGSYTGIMAIIAVTIPDANTHTVTFDTGGHFAAPESQNVEDGGYATEPTTPSWRQYTPATDGSGLYFHAWYIAPPDDSFTYTDLNYSRANGGKIFDFNAEAITADTTVYAGWDTVLETRSYDVTNSALSQGGQTRVGSVYYDGSSYTPFVGNTTAIAGTEATVYAKPDDGYTFVGWSTTTSKDDIVDTATEYTFTVTSKASYYALFEKEVPSDDLTFNFVNYGHAPASLTDLVTSVTVNGEDWPLPDTGMDLTNPVPVGSKVTAVVRVADNAIFLYAWSEYLSDLEYQYSDDYSTCTLTFTTPPWAWSPTGIIPEVHCLVDKAVDIHYDANGGTRGPGWYGGQGDVEKLSAFVAENWTEWDVNDLLVTPDDAGEIVVYPPEGATSAGVEITDKKGVHTGAPGETITGLDLSEGATIKYLWTRDIDKVEITLDAPACGTEITTPDEEDPWSQTNPPSVSVPDGAGYKLNNMYGGAPAIWVNSDPNYEPFEGTMKGGETYLAQIMLVPDSGAAFSENVEIVVNGGTPVNKDLSESVLAVFASVTAVHDPADPVEENRVEPTCTVAGSYDEVVYCKGCHTELSRVTKEIPAPGHTPGSPVKENEVTPTCTEAGSYDVVVYCTVCGEEISRNAVDIPALGHTWDAGEVTTEPTCTTAGAKTFTCTVCGETKTEEIPALGHAWGEWIVDKEATEEEEGLRHHVCSRCETMEEEVIPKIEVSYGVAEGEGAIWYTGSNDSLTFTFKRSVNDEKTFELFQRIEIDGKEVAPANYEAKAGSVIITLKPEYIKTLAVGKHTLTAVFENGKTADATFTITEKKADVVPGGDTAKKGTGVKTGDNANAVLYMGLGIAALLIIAVTLILLKRRSRNEQ